MVLVGMDCFRDFKSEEVRTDSTEYSQLANELSNGCVDDAEAKHSTSADCDCDVAR